MIRRGYYCKYKKKIFFCGFLGNDIVILWSNDIEDTKKRGFSNNERFIESQNNFCNRRNTKYIKKTTIEQIDWFCDIHTIGYYRGYKVSVDGESATKYAIMTGIIELGNKIFTEENGFEMFDRQIYIGEVPKSEVTNITEIKTPINKKYKAPDNWDF